MKKRRRRLFSFRGPQAVGEFTLGSRRQPSRRKAARMNVTRAAMLTFGALIVLSAFMIARIFFRSLHTKRLNAELAALHAAQATVSAPAPTLAQRVSPSPELLALPDASPDATAPAALFHQFGGTPLARMEALYEQNRDIIGWLEIPDVLDLPVMYRDNSYYLTHDFNKNKSAAGTLFLDEHHRFTERTQNLLLHGHNMKDGTMFGHLVHYLKDIDYYRAHPFVNFDTLWQEEKYIIFSVLCVSLDTRDERFMNYFSYPTFASDQQFDAYVRQLQLKSVYAIPIDVEPSDALLTLSTCMDEDRLVIVCRRIREGESRARLRELSRLSMRQ